MERIKILNVGLDNYSSRELLEKLDKGVLVTPNVDDIMQQQRDKEFYELARNAEFSICDSKIVHLSSKLIHRPLKEAIPGSSFFSMYCDYHKNDDVKIFLLGAREGVADIAKVKINIRVGRDIIIGTYSPPFGFERDPEEIEHIVGLLRNSTATGVLVGVGAPKQEKWIMDHKESMPKVKLWMALGATIDFEAGNIKRAPKIFQKLALEWLYRMYCEPKRMFKRYICDDLAFFWYLFKDIIGIYRNPFENNKC